MFKRLFIVVTALFLVACSRGMSGPTTTTCANAPGIIVGDETVVIIEGYGEEIRTWTERTVLTREQLTQHLTEGEDLTDDEIAEMIEYLNTLEEAGFQWELISLDEDAAIIEYVYDYEAISNEVLSERWGVDDFEREVTLSSAIRGLEDQDAVCDIE